jgi:hypothetical protein
MILAQAYFGSVWRDLTQHELAKSVEIRLVAAEGKLVGV